MNTYYPLKLGLVTVHNRFYSILFQVRIEELNYSL